MMPRRAVIGRCGSFQVLHLLAELLDHGLQLQPDIGQLDVVRLRAQRIGFAVELLRQEVELAADRAARRRSCAAPARHARPGGRAPRGCRPWRRSGSPPDAAGRDRSGVDVSSSVATCSASRALIASALRPGAASARAVSAAISSSRPRSTAASASPSRRRISVRLASASAKPAVIAASAARRSSSRSSSSIDLDHALEREDAVDARRRRIDALGDILHGRRGPRPAPAR